MIEATFWKSRLRPQLRQECAEAGLRAHFERIENGVGDGTPDVDFCIEGVAGKLELKYQPRDPVRSTTPVLGKGNGLRRSQIIWIARRLHAGGLVYVAIGTPRRTWVVDVRGSTARALAGLELYTADMLDRLDPRRDCWRNPGSGSYLAAWMARSTAKIGAQCADHPIGGTTPLAVA